MDFARLRIGKREHAFIAGATGCGKSELAQWLINDPGKKYSIVYDPKHSETITEWRNQTFIYSWQELKRSKDRRIVYRPSLEAYRGADGKLTNEAEDERCQEEFFQYVFITKRRRVYVDEVSALLGGSNPNYYLKGCLTRGRELGISTVCATQRPVSIPIIMMSESTKKYVFRLEWPDDQERMEKLTGGRITVKMQGLLQDFEFYFYDGAKKWHWPKPIKLNLSRIPPAIPRPLFGAPSHLEGGIKQYGS
jgi:energy-coupling factor transporter ATP-binding protein EcfA2